MIHLRVRKPLTNPVLVVTLFFICALTNVSAQSGSIGGTIFGDVNKNSARDIGEPGLAGRKVNLYGTKEDSTYTDSLGNYSFSGLPYGCYIVTQGSRSNWILSYPFNGGTRLFTLSQPILTGLDFGNVPTEITGKVYTDLRDSIKGLSGWKVRLHGLVDTVAITDSSGIYVFRDFPWGNYTITEDSISGWAQTVPPTITSIPESLVTVSLEMNSRLQLILDDAYYNYYLRPPDSLPCVGTYLGYSIPGGYQTDEFATYQVKTTSRTRLTISAISRFGLGLLYKTIDSTGQIIVSAISNTIDINGIAPIGGYSLSIPRFSTLRYRAGYNRINFGNARSGVVQGSLYNDLNKNGIKDSIEIGIPGRKILIGGPLVDSTVTDSLGDFHFVNLYPGMYFVTQGYTNSSNQFSPPSVMKPNRDSIIANLNTSLHVLFLLAEGAVRYRLTPIDLFGGDGIFCGFFTGRTYYSYVGIMSSIVYSDCYTIRFKISSKLGFGNVSATVTSSGKLDSISVDGEFSKLGYRIINTDSSNSVIRSVNFGNNDSITSAIDDKTPIGIPKNFVLYQNFPNPFNPITRIRYDLPKESKVVLRIYNTLGQTVATLVNEVQSAGYKTVDFSLHNLPSGMYFYQLKASEFSAVKKMLLIR